MGEHGAPSPPAGPARPAGHTAPGGQLGRAGGAWASGRCRTGHRGQVRSALRDVSTRARSHQGHLYRHRTRGSLSPRPPAPPPAWRCSHPSCGPLFSSDLVKSLFCNELRLLIKEMS